MVRTRLCYGRDSGVRGLHLCFVVARCVTVPDTDTVLNSDHEVAARSATSLQPRSRDSTEMSEVGAAPSTPARDVLGPCAMNVEVDLDETQEVVELVQKKRKGDGGCSTKSRRRCYDAA